MLSKDKNHWKRFEQVKKKKIIILLKQLEIPKDFTSKRQL